MKSDPYDAVKRLCVSLEAEGVEPDLIVDALLTVGMNAGARLGGPEHVSSYCLKMAEVFQAKAENRAAPTTRTQ